MEPSPPPQPIIEVIEADTCVTTQFTDGSGLKTVCTWTMSPDGGSWIGSYTRRDGTPMVITFGVAVVAEHPAQPTQPQRTPDQPVAAIPETRSNPRFSRRLLRRGGRT